MSFDEEYIDLHRQCADEIDRLEKELERAYRALHGFRMAHVRGERLNDTAVAYHCMTIAAAARWVNEKQLDGADYFVGKHFTVLHDALKVS